MLTAECFHDINRQCRQVVALIHEAQETHDPVASTRLYHEARDRTAAISGAVRHQLSQMDGARHQADAA